MGLGTAVRPRSAILRDREAEAHTPADPVRAALADPGLVPGRVVGVELRRLGHRLDRPRTNAGRGAPRRSGRCTSAHAIVVAGVIIVAVAIGLTIDDPTAVLSAAVATTILVGPITYLTGLALFKRSVPQGKAGPPLAGVLALALDAPLALVVDRLTLSCLAAAALVVLAVAGGRSAHERPFPADQHSS